MIPQLQRTLKAIPKQIEDIKHQITNLESSIQITKKELVKPFAHEQEIKEKSERFHYLQQELDKLNHDPNSEPESVEESSRKEKPSVLKQLKDNNTKILPSIPSTKGEVCL